MTNQELWQITLGEIELSISKANFITWFKNTNIIENEKGKITISVPNGFTKEWLKNKYNKIIKDNNKFHVVHWGDQINVLEYSNMGVSHPSYLRRIDHNLELLSAEALD